MRIEYNPRKFLLLIPMAMLRQYFEKRGFLGGLDWDGLQDGDHETVYAAWQADMRRYRRRFRPFAPMPILNRVHGASLRSSANHSFGAYPRARIRGRGHLSLRRLDPHTIARGRRQLLDQDVEVGRIRQPGVGRKPVEKKSPK
jgi:hypothetical protein